MYALVRSVLESPAVSLQGPGQGQGWGAAELPYLLQHAV